MLSRCPYINFLLWGFAWTAWAFPNKKELLQRKQHLQHQVAATQRVLQHVAKKQHHSLAQLSVLQQQIRNKQQLIQVVKQEQHQAQHSLQQQTHKRKHLTQLLQQLRSQYARMIYEGAKIQTLADRLVFVFAAPSFYALMQRLQTVRHYARARRDQLTHIQTTNKQVLATQQRIRHHQQHLQQLASQRQREKQHLEQVQHTTLKTLNALKKQRKQLQQQLRMHNTTLKAVAHLMQQVLQEETQHTITAQHTTKPSSSLPALPSIQPKNQHFLRNRGKLPWPVNSGVVTGHFGLHQHPVFKRVRVENFGIDIQTTPGTLAKSVCEGQVKTIAVVPGMQHVIIVAHGAYHTVYAHLKDTKVRTGQKISALQPLGTLHTNTAGNTQLQFQIWRGATKLNPLKWLAPSGS